MTNETKNGELFFCNLFRIIKFFFLILQIEATLESKVARTNRNSSAFLLHSSKTFSNVELFSIFSQTFLELIFATKIKTMLLKPSAFLFTSCQKILGILYVWILKILLINKRMPILMNGALSHLWPRKPERIHWKADAPKTNDCLVRILIQRHNSVGNCMISRGSQLNEVIFRY